MSSIRGLKSIISSRKYYLLGAVLYAFLIPFPQKLVSGAMVIWLILSFIGINENRITKNKLLWILPALYFAYLVSMIISGDFSMKILEHKLSLLVFPALFVLAPYSREDRNTIYKALVTGLLFSGLICLLYALFRSVEPVEGGFEFSANVLEDRGFLESIRYGGNYFFGRYFSVFHQTVYYALYLSLGIAILLFKNDLFPEKHRFGYLAFFLLILFLISNKAAYIVLLVIFVYHIASRSIPTGRKIVFLTAFVVLAGLFAWTNPRIKNSLETAILNKWELKKNARYGFATRLLSWDAAVTLIREKPIWGHGAGNAQEAFDAMYMEKEYRFPLRDRLNAHNQFLQSWVENGLPGLFLWTLALVLAYLGAIKNQVSRNLLIVFVLIILINALFESVLNRFSGISIISFLLCLIISGGNRAKNNIT